MKQRLEHLAGLGTSMVCFSGGEPMLHPDLEELIRHGRDLGMFVELLTNGYFLTQERIEGLNRAGLERLQISVDNVMPDDVSKKSLKVLDKKLVNLSRYAEFDVNINSVLGAEIKQADDALEVTRRARELGLSSTVGIIHDGDGQLSPLGEHEAAVYERLRSMSPVGFSLFTGFKDNLARGLPNDWRCRAGARYLYVCEDGLVHYCSQQRGMPGTPLLEYTRAMIEREFHTEKTCAPMCTVSCVHAVAPFDAWRPQSGSRVDMSKQPPASPPLVELRRKSQDQSTG